MGTKTKRKQMKSRNEAEIKQLFSEFRKRNRTDGEMEIAPLRGIDDFILTKSRFQIPNFQDEDRWFNRIVYNLMYYQKLSAVELHNFRICPPKSTSRNVDRTVSHGLGVW